LSGDVVNAFPAAIIRASFLILLAAASVKLGVPAASTVGAERFIIVRKLAAVDIVYRGERAILVEFGFGVFVLGTLGVAFLLFAHQQTPLTTSIGVYLLFLAINYVPLFAHSISLSLNDSARQEVEYDLTHDNAFRKKYGVQQVLILVPLAIVLLAIVQRERK
jgi:hypothetical protein